VRAAAVVDADTTDDERYCSLVEFVAHVYVTLSFLCCPHFNLTSVIGNIGASVLALLCEISYFSTFQSFSALRGKSAQCAKQVCGRNLLMIMWM